MRSEKKKCVANYRHIFEKNSLNLNWKSEKYYRHHGQLARWWHKLSVYRIEAERTLGSLTSLFPSVFHFCILWYFSCDNRQRKDGHSEKRRHVFRIRVNGEAGIAVVKIEKYIIFCSSGRRVVYINGPAMRWTCIRLQLRKLLKFRRTSQATVQKWHKKRKATFLQ